jgi:hypothetical protein
MTSKRQDAPPTPEVEPVATEPRSLTLALWESGRLVPADVKRLTPEVRRLLGLVFAHTEGLLARLQREPTIEDFAKLTVALYAIREIAFPHNKAEPRGTLPGDVLFKKTAYRDPVCGFRRRKLAIAEGTEWREFDASAAMPSDPDLFLLATARWAGQFPYVVVRRPSGDLSLLIGHTNSNVTHGHADIANPAAYFVPGTYNKDVRDVPSSARGLRWRPSQDRLLFAFVLSMLAFDTESPKARQLADLLRQAETKLKISELPKPPSFACEDVGGADPLYQQLRRLLLRVARLIAARRKKIAKIVKARS